MVNQSVMDGDRDGVTDNNQPRKHRGASVIEPLGLFLDATQMLHSTSIE